MFTAGQLLAIYAVLDTHLGPHHPLTKRVQRALDKERSQ